MKKRNILHLVTLFLLVTLNNLHASIEEKNLDLIQQSVKQVNFENPILIDMPRGQKKNLMVKMIRSSLKQALAETDKLEVVTLYTKMISATTSGEAVSLNLDLLPVIEQTALAISEELRNWPAMKQLGGNADWVQIIAKVTDSIIEGSLRPALKSRTDMALLSQSIAFGTAAPFMQDKETGYSTLIKVAKGINYGIPYKFVDSILTSAPREKQPEIIQKISRNTSYGTIAAAIESNLEYEEIVHAATDAFSSSVITIASKKQMPLENIATLTKFASQGIMTGTVDASTDADLPFGELGAVMITKLEGDIQIERISTGEKIAKEQIAIGSNLFQDHSVITGDNGNVTLLFSNGTITNLEPNSKLSIYKFTQEPFDVKEDKLSDLKNEPSTSHTELDLKYGNLVFNVKKLNRGSYMNIKSPLGNAAIKGTKGKFTVILLPNGNATGGLSLATGAVDFGSSDTFSPSSSASGLTLNNGETSNGNETISIKPGQSISVEANNADRATQTPALIRADPITATETKEISQITLDQNKTAGNSGISQILNIINLVQNQANIEVTGRVGETSRVVAAGVGGAGVGAIQANGITDPSNKITQATAEGIATGSVLASKERSLNFVNIAYKVSIGTVQGAATKTIEFEYDIEETMGAIGNGHDQTLAGISDLSGLFTRSQILAVSDALSRGRGEGLELTLERFPIFDPFQRFDEQNSPEELAQQSEQQSSSFTSGNSTTTTTTTTTSTTPIVTPIIQTGGGSTSPIN